MKTPLKKSITFEGNRVTFIFSSTGTKKGNNTKRRKRTTYFSSKGPKELKNSTKNRKERGKSGPCPRKWLFVAFRSLFT